MSILNYQYIDKVYGLLGSPDVANSMNLQYLPIMLLSCLYDSLAFCNKTFDICSSRLEYFICVLMAMDM